MPIAPSKWRARSERKSTEQRTRAKRRAFSRDSRGRFSSKASTSILNLDPLPAKKIVNDLLAKPLMVGGQSYRVTEISHSVGFSQYTGQVTVLLQPMYQRYERLNTMQLNTMQPTYYSNTGGTMAYTSQQAWTNWTADSSYTMNNYQTIQNPQIAWTGWIRDLERLQPALENEWQNYQNKMNPPRTPEQQAADQVAVDQRRHQEALMQAERNRVCAIAREAQDTASRRALATFIEVLNTEERESYERDKCIYVRSQRGRRYRIKCVKGQSGNVELLNEHGATTAGFCVHPAYDRSSGMLLPDADAWITQKLFLEHDEDQFLKVANLTKGVRPAQGLIVPGMAMAA